MFKIAILRSFILAVGLISAQANAALLHTDWQAVGDKKAFVDSDTGVEWLNLAVTTGKSYNQVVSMQSGVLSGWRFPTQTEIFGLMKKMFTEITSIDSSSAYWNKKMLYAPWTDPADRALFHQLFGWTQLMYIGSTLHIQSTLGLYVGNDGTIKAAGINKQNSANAYQSFSELAYGHATSSTPDSVFSHYGYFLVSDGGETLSSVQNPTLNINNPNAPVNQVPEAPADVSEHVGFGLLGLLLMAFGIRRRKSAFA